MDRGVLFSGAGHAGLILWMLIGGIFFEREPAEEVQVTSVSLVSSSEFEAILGAAPSAPAPDPAQTEVAAPAPVEQPQDTPPPTPATEPDTPPPEPPVAAVEPTPPDAPPPPADEPPPPPAPEPEPVLEPQPPAPVSLDPPVEAVVIETRPRPRPALRVAPEPTAAPEPEAVQAPVPTPAVAAEPTPEPQQVTPEQPEAVAEDAGTELATEANQPSPLAPAASARPRARPAQPAAAPAPETATASSQDAIAAALAAAGAETPTDAPATADAPTTAAAASGPPMSFGEKDALRVAVQACWNVGSLSSEALRVTVTLAVSLGENGVPDTASIRMTEFEGGSEAAARQAYEAGRRAVIVCGAKGFQLPPEKYEQWKELELVFNPERMRVK